MIQGRLLQESLPVQRWDDIIPRVGHLLHNTTDTVFVRVPEVVVIDYETTRGYDKNDHNGKRDVSVLDLFFIKGHARNPFRFRVIEETATSRNLKFHENVYL